ncbi:MAG: ATP-binding cassette domain-containing protein, partial [Mycobacterium sp.]|nr:ATP-binding cassette domain-containing protein [Mycobacterium sp.]
FSLAVVVAALVAISVVVQIRARSALAAVLAARSKTDSLLLEYLRALVPIRVGAAETKAFARLADLQAQWLGALSLRIQRLMMSAPLATLGPLLINVVLVALVVSLGRQLPPREFLPIYAAVIQLTVAMTIVSANLTRLWEIGPVFARMDPLLDAAPERAVPGRRPEPLSGALSLTNVVFGYDHEQPPLFDGLNLSVAPGEFVAIVGPSGSGKTTILRLLLGFEQPWSGVITYDNSDLEELDPAAVRRQIGTVTQSALPFGATFRECVCGPLRVTDDQLWETLRKAGLEEVVRRSDGGLDAPVGDQGSALSGGQRQRLMIARALLGQPRIVLLDEATSALDNVSQEIVMSAIMDLPVTRIAIAHRLSTIARADRVVVVTDGRVVEEGTPQELLDRAGHFARLAARQEF